MPPSGSPRSSSSLAPNPVPEPPWRAGLRAARACIAPGLVLQSLALAIVWAYYHHEPSRALLGRLAEFRTQHGFSFSAISTMLLGGLVPFLYLRCRAATRAAHPWPHLPFFLLLWAFKGVEVDVFYRALDWLLGAGTHWTTIVLKTIIDQFVYNPLWGTPVVILLYAWKDAGFQGNIIRQDLGTRGWYRRRVWPALLANWGVWVPTVSIIYMLPNALQIPLFNVVICFWTILLTTLVTPSPPMAPSRLD